MKNYLSVLFLLVLTSPLYAKTLPPMLLSSDGEVIDDSENVAPAENINNLLMSTGEENKSLSKVEEKSAEDKNVLPTTGLQKTQAATKNKATEEATQNKALVPLPPAENTTPEELPPEPVEYLPDPSNFSADFMSSLYQCQPNSEQQNLSDFEKISIIGATQKGCRLLYDQFILTVPTELLPNIHSMTDIRKLLQNSDISKYQPQYEYSGLLQELDICSQNPNGHNAYLHRQTKNDVTITLGLTSKVENGGCTVRLLNQLNIGENFSDYSVVCKIPAEDMQLILDVYKDLLSQDAPDEKELKKADDEIMFRLQQVGYCQKPKL